MTIIFICIYAIGIFMFGKIFFRRSIQIHMNRWASLGLGDSDIAFYLVFSILIGCVFPFYALWLFIDVYVIKDSIENYAHKIANDRK